MSKIKNGGLNQYDAEPFEQRQLQTVGNEGVKTSYENSAQTEISITHLQTKAQTPLVSTNLQQIEQV